MTGTRTRPPGAERGITLIEMLVVIVVVGFVVVGLAQVLTSIFTNSKTVVDRVASSDSALRTSARFDDDVASAVAVDTIPAIARSAAGCGGDSASLVRFVARSQDGSQVVVTSYHVVGQTLVRRTCRGATFSAALAAAPTTLVAVDEVRPASPPTVGCTANIGAPPAPPPPGGDAQCRIVTMALTTVDGTVNELRGVRTAAPLEASPPILRQCTLVVADNANVYQDQPNRNFNDRDDYGESPGGRNFIEDRSASNKIIRGHFRFNLAGACDGRDQGEPAFMPPQRPLTSATLKLTYHDAAQNGSDGKCNAQHTLDVLALAWDPATLTWNTSPQQTNASGALQPIRHGFSTLATWVDRPMTVDVLPEALRWYPAPGGGDWPNYGWVVSALPNGCDAKDSHKWMSKGSNSSLAPRLVLTWVE